MLSIVRGVFANLKKRKTLTVLRFLGLIVGFTVFAYILEINSREKSYDYFWPDSEKIYRAGLNLTQSGELVTHSAKNFPGSVHLLKEEIPGIETVCIFYKDVITVFTDQKQFADVQWLWSDTTFFQIFPRKIVQSAHQNLFSDLHGVMLSKSFARKLFGEENPLQKKFKLNEGWEFVVSGIFEDIPKNSHFSVDVVAGVNSLWYYMQHFDNQTGLLNENPDYRPSRLNPYEQGAWSTPAAYRPYCFFKLERNTDVSSIEAQSPIALQKVSFPQYMTDMNVQFDFQRVTDIHLRSKLEHEYQLNGSQSRVNFLYLIAWIVLLVCAVNFVNMGSISCMASGKQYAIRMINGASQFSVVSVLLAENLVLTLIAAIGGSGIALWISGKINGEFLFYTENIIMILLLAIVLAAASTLVSYYSTLKGRFTEYLKTQSKSLAGRWTGRKSLVVLQFAVSIVLIAGTILIKKQLSFISSYELGFKPEQTIYSFSPMSMIHKPDMLARLSAFKSEVLTIPGVKEFSVSSSIPGKEIARYAEDVRLDEKAEPLSATFQLMSINEGFAPLFELKFLAGNNLKEKIDWQSDEVLVNQSAVEEMGFSQPEEVVGKFIGFGGKVRQIAGIVADYHHLSLKNKVAPMIFTQDLRWDYSVGYYALRYESKRTSEVLAAVEKLWTKVYPGETTSFSFTDDRYASQYRDEQQFNQLLSLCSLMALFISCVGLFAIASFDTQKRIREVGIRKVNGATTANILTLLNKDLLRWVLVSLLFALPASWYGLNLWLENFAYKTQLSWWIFASSGLLALGIALLTVSFQSWKAATHNPVEALRYE